MELPTESNATESMIASLQLLSNDGTQPLMNKNWQVFVIVFFGWFFTGKGGVRENRQETSCNFVLSQ